ncbi:hypothetical protein JCM19239_7060 [Vibrio variabilis]|uniref:HTH cro/C1-type domain-containing protein n=1 Tax=Vibrio variabilis TaxID=990271 RepID=A0ABQ0JM20_9VIBR|nr:hypothetical protein JCM19239_7060 [Vibrio variabilis]
MSQVRAAEMLGMNQSAFSQYLRGTVPLNLMFITKFARLVGEEPSHFDESLGLLGSSGKLIPAPAPIEVEYGVTGIRHTPPKIVVTPGNYSPEERVAVEIDSPHYGYKLGMLMICDTTTTICRETSEVVVFDKDKELKGMGELTLMEDNTWSVQIIFQGRINYVSIVESDFVFNVVGGYYAEPVYKRVYNQQPKNGNQSLHWFP